VRGVLFNGWTAPRGVLPDNGVGGAIDAASELQFQTPFLPDRAGWNKGEADATGFDARFARERARFLIGGTRRSAAWEDRASRPCAGSISPRG